MRLIHTPTEATLEGSVAELADVGQKLGAMSPGMTIAVEAKCDQIPSAKLVITENGQEFLASWDPDAGLRITGSAAALVTFADTFFFNCEPVPGLHAHWDVAGVFDFVASESLPLIVRLA